MTTTGNDTGAPRFQQRRSIVEGLRAAAPLLGEAGMTLMLEPLNTRVDHPGYYLAGANEGLEIVGEVDHASVRLLFDIYHQQIMEGDLIRTITKHIDWIGHFHAAGNPGRRELHLGEIHYPAVFQAIADTSYEGYIGLEYFPLNDPLDGLKRVLRLSDLNSSA
ncbi:TIM barrel protein [Paenibacillus sp.]|uniref:TIM barrel protein n=1 Tax=Paenibacillus sp. TaxID=58172 RepID=UPI002D73FE5D|nr:TIM barrel protein [Paenibacillus sp.]HZG55610.1 TIM barrel protein [Paenibacillus sp.]